jgi:hypothetical protein
MVVRRREATRTGTQTILQEVRHMKIRHVKTLKNGKRHALVELDPGEHVASYRESRYYKLGYPSEEIVASHVLDEAVPVTWCSASQEWVE